MTEEIRLTVGIPSSGFVRSGFAHSLANLMGHLCSVGIKTRTHKSLIIKLEMIEGSVIHMARELIVTRALESDSTHLLFLDDDMVFDADILDSMFARKQPVALCNYLLKTEEPVFLSVDKNKQHILTSETSTGIELADSGGFGVSLFETEVFKKTPQPWFLPLYIKEQGKYTTEDVPFFYRVRKQGFPVYVDHDASKKVEHIGNKRWSWNKDFPVSNNQSSKD
jgi:hypothetical protein